MTETQQRTNSGNESAHSLFVTRETLKTFVELTANTIAEASNGLKDNLSTCELRDRVIHIRDCFSRDLKQSAKIITPYNLEFATEITGFLQPLEGANEVADEKVINKVINTPSVYKEETEKNKEKENLPPTPPIREKENKKEKEVKPSPSAHTHAHARARVGRTALRTPSRCTATWHPTPEEVIVWADFHIFKGKDETEWIKWWYEQMEDVLEWQYPDTSRFINWKYTLRAWWRNELFLRKSAERDKKFEERSRKLAEIDELRAETAKLYNEKAKQKPTIITAAQRAPNYLPHNLNQKKGFFR